MKKDKAKVLNEEMSDEQIRGFLAAHPPVHVHADFHCLVRAYRGLTAPDFERFLAVFVAEGRDLDARNEHGETLLEVVSCHESSGDYVAALKQAGASGPG